MHRISPTHRNAIFWICYALLLAVLPWIFPGALGLSVLSQMAYLSIACLSYNLLLGYGGMLSFGHAIYTGAGSLAVIHLLRATNQGLVMLPVSLLPMAGGLAGGLVAALLGWVATKKASTAFAMITFGLGELCWALSLLLPEYFGGDGGLSADRVTGPVVGALTWGPQTQLYGLIAVYAFTCTALMFAFLQTPFGRMLQATRDNAARVEFLGYDAHRVRYGAFVVSGLFAGIAGGLAALNFELVSSEAFSSMNSGVYLLFTYVGGTGAFFGPIIGAVLMTLATVLLSTVTKAWLLYIGLFFIVTVMYLPGGIAGLFEGLVRAARAGRLARAVPWSCVAALAMATALVAGGAGIEMLYHRLDAEASTGRFDYFGVTLDAVSAPLLACSLALAAAALAAFAAARRRVVWRLAERTPEGAK
ncbi:branched-chain amino acid ABC transporter permease [Variovorax sp. PDNC026]|uniref:branched-chain amino acid ABC transporter permease n=1 Tax=Variovorax sp. PDNC026 TaxID=2811425 RepID=UPI001F059FAE|nr:branched-chain amino acid ABC transporter permease [Variovorax sp. PDNC026]